MAEADRPQDPALAGLGEGGAATILAGALPCGALLVFDRELRCALAAGEALRGIAGGGAGLVGELPERALEPLLGDSAFPAVDAVAQGESRRMRLHGRGSRVFDVSIAPAVPGDADCGCVVLALDVSMQAQLEAERDALLEIAAVTTRGAPLEDVLHLVAVEMGRLFGAVSTVVTRFEPGGGETFVALTPSPLGPFTPGMPVPAGSGTALEAVAVEAVPVAIPDYGDATSEVIEALRAEGAIGGIAAPILIGRDVWGAIGIAAADPERLVPEAADRLARVAEIVSALIANAEVAERLRAREEQYRTLTERSPDAIYTVGDDGTIEYASPAIRGLLGYEPDEIVGMNLAEIVHPDDHWAFADIDAPVRTESRYEVRARRADGSWEWVEFVGSGVIGADGVVAERQGSARSIQARKEAEAAADARAAQYRALARSLPGGAVFLYDRELRYQLADGTRVDDFTGGLDVIGRTPRDVLPEWLIADAEAVYREALAGGTRRWRWPGASGALYDVTAAPVHEGDRVVAGMVLAIDVTVRAQLEEEQAALLAIAEAAARGEEVGALLALVVERVATVFGATGATILRLDADGMATVVAGSPDGFVDRIPGGRLPLDRRSAVGRFARAGRPYAVPVFPPGPDPLVEAVRSFGAVGGAAAPITIGGRLWGALALASAEPATMTQEVADRLARFAELIATTIAGAEAISWLRGHAATDALTGLATREAFEDRLRGEVARARRAGVDLALVIVDADDLRGLNDTHGHPVGDDALAAIAAIVARAARPGELVARFGGAGMAWILPHEGLDAAAAGAEGVRAAVEALRHPELPPVTVSAGVVALAADEDADALLRRATAALRRAKDAGRNRVEVIRGGLDASPAAPAARLRAEALAGVRALARTVDAGDPSTLQHSERVAALARRLALALGWSLAGAERLHEAGLLHDVGKLGVREEVLLKPSELDDDERAEVRRHAVLGARIVADVLDREQVAWLRGHHERYDGTGYPDGLVGEAIPLGASILALADAFDAMTTVRTYRTPIAVAEAVRECTAQRGRQFAPAVVDALGALHRRGELDPAQPVSA